MAECEQARRIAEDAKQDVIIELSRKKSRLDIRKDMEKERQRRIKLLKQMAKGESKEAIEMATTNAKLSGLHKDLKESFKKIEVSTLIDLFSLDKTKEKFTSHMFH